MGLKENVIIGKLIPAGTGMKRYKKIDIDYETMAAEDAMQDVEIDETEGEEVSETEVLEEIIES